MRLIDADALKEFYGKWANRNTEFMKGEIDGYIDAQPTIEAEPVRHGEWVGGELGYCTCCGLETCASDVWNDVMEDWHCPKCGAKVKGVW